MNHPADETPPNPHEATWLTIVAVGIVLVLFIRLFVPMYPGQAAPESVPTIVLPWEAMTATPRADITPQIGCPATHLDPLGQCHRVYAPSVGK